MSRGHLGAQRRGKQKAIGSHGWGLGGNGSDDEGDGGEAEEFSGGD